MKILPITKQTAQALSNGADTILVPIDDIYKLLGMNQEFNHIHTITGQMVYFTSYNYGEQFEDELEISKYLPLQVGDKFEAIHHEVVEDDSIIDGITTTFNREAVSIEIIQTTMIEYEDAVSISQGDGADFMSWVDEQHGDGFYSSNRYVALIKTKELTDEAIITKGNRYSN